MENKKSSWSWVVGVLLLSLSLFSAVLAKAEEPEESIKSSLNELFDEGTLSGDKQERCRESIAKARSSGFEERSEEELMQVCLSMPANHDTDCGFPFTTEEYYVVENQQCVSKLAGKSLMHAQARKVEARERTASFYDPYITGSEPGDGEPDEIGTGSAQ